MLPVLFTWPYEAVYLVVALWIGLSERAMRRRARVRASEQDRKSARLIDVGAVVATVSAIVVALVFKRGALPYPTLLFWVGLGLVIASGLLRRHCFHMLGASFTGVVHVVPGQEIVDRGVYRLIRHPSYTGSALAFIGIGLALGNWASLVILLGSCWMIYGYRVRVEERALLDILGEPYRDYMARTKRFIPFLF
jgi:protein-S-isoprenylcysteine O-methyltransferase Ste14